MKIYTLVLSCMVLLATCGCGKQKGSLASLPPDPAACSSFTYDEQAPYKDLKKIAELGCLRKLNEWAEAYSGYDFSEGMHYLKLTTAIILGDTEETKELLNAGLNISEDEELLRYFLGLAISFGNEDAVKELLKDTKNVKKLFKLRENNRWPEAFYIMADTSIYGLQTENSDRAMIAFLHLLVQNGFDVNTHAGGGPCKASSLWIWPRSANKLLVTQELEKMGYQVTQQDKNMALVIAANMQMNDKGTYGNVETVKDLVKEGAEINGKATPCAAITTYEGVKEKGNPEMIALFQALGAKE